MIFIGVVGGGPAALSYEGTVSSVDIASANVRSHTSVPVGGPETDRQVFVVAHWFPNVSKALVSATIGGVAATIHVQSGATTLGVALISAPLPSGTTATVVLTLESGAASYSSSVAAFRVTGLVSAIAFDTDLDFAVGDTTKSVTVDLKGDGILLTGASLSSGAAAYGISVATELYESMPLWVGGGDEITADEAARVITFSRSGGAGTTFNGALVAASFR